LSNVHAEGSQRPSCCCQESSSREPASGTPALALVVGSDPEPRDRRLRDGEAEAAMTSRRDGERRGRQRGPGLAEARWRARKGRSRLFMASIPRSFHRSSSVVAGWLSPPAAVILGFYQLQLPPTGDAGRTPRVGCRSQSQKAHETRPAKP
jgi:hypothetical protein